MSEFQHNRTIAKTRGTHPCEQCGTPIESGSKAHYAAGNFEGYFYSWYIHDECNTAANAYCKLHGLFADEYMWFQHQLEETDDKLWLLENHHIVAERLGLVREEPA